MNTISSVVEQYIKSKPFLLNSCSKTLSAAFSLILQTIFPLMFVFSCNNNFSKIVMNKIYKKFLTMSFQFLIIRFKS